jgi:hypothetical protein
MSVLALLAAVAALAAPPFPAPRLAPVTDKTKCDTGTVLTVEPARSELRVTTPAGVVTYKAPADAQVFDKDGKPAGAASRLVAGQAVRVYYVVEDGARVVEIDLQ